MNIEIDDLERQTVRKLLAGHLAQMLSMSPACSVHALDLDRLRQPGIRVWTAWEDEQLLGCGALKELTPLHGEIKSMRTVDAHRGKGVGRAVLAHLLAVARERGYGRVSLETGMTSAFLPAQRLYESAGFQRCEPFGSYREDPHSLYMTRLLD